MAHDAGYRQRNTALVSDPVILALNMKAMEMFAPPVEGNLNIGMELGEAGCARNQETPPNQGAHSGEDEAQLIDAGWLWRLSHTGELTGTDLRSEPDPTESNALRKNCRAQLTVSS